MALDEMIKKSYDRETGQAVLYWKPFIIHLSVHTTCARYYRDTDVDIDHPCFELNWDEPKMRLARIALGIDAPPPKAKPTIPPDKCPCYRMENRVEYLKVLDGGDILKGPVNCLYANASPVGDEVFLGYITRDFRGMGFKLIEQKDYNEFLAKVIKRLGI